MEKFSAILSILFFVFVIGLLLMANACAGARLPNFCERADAGDAYGQMRCKP